MRVLSVERSHFFVRRFSSQIKKSLRYISRTRAACPYRVWLESLFSGLWAPRGNTGFYLEMILRIGRKISNIQCRPWSRSDWFRPELGNRGSIRRYRRPIVGLGTEVFGTRLHFENFSIKRGLLADL